MFKHLSIGKVKAVVVTCVLSLAVVNLMPASAAPSTQLITCVDLVSGKERISKTGTCRSTTEAMAKWRLAKSDSALASGKSTKTLTVCSNKENSSITYQLIRASCAKHMQLSLYARSSALPDRPVITQVFSTSHESASLTLGSDPASILDAPIAYYTITSSKGDVVRVNSWRELTVSVSGLMSSTSYSFTITATNADGTSPVSESSSSVTTQVYVAKVASSPALTCATGGTCIVGDRGPGGGIVFYVSATPFTSAGSTCNTACKYLEVAPATWKSNSGSTVENDTITVWSSNNTTLTGQDVSTAGSESLFTGEKLNWKIGQGFYNTSVMKVSGATSPAQAAVLAYAGNSIAGQWFIPSMNELNELCKYARGQTTGVLTTKCNGTGTLKTGTANDLGGFRYAYWSSSESSGRNVYYQDFSNEVGGTPGYQSGNQKADTSIFIRPIRAF